MDVASATTAQSASAQASTGLADDFSTFLTLLTSQLQNQDPLEPLDTNEFTSQLVQFTEVEQTIATNSHLEELISLQRATDNQAAVDYIGKVVTAKGEDATLLNGAASWRYDLSADAATVDITIKNADGFTVYTGEGERTAGEHLFYWDGANTAGEVQPDGVYTMEITAKDAETKPVSAEIFFRDVVGGVSFDEDGTTLRLAGATITLADVKRIEQVF